MHVDSLLTTQTPTTLHSSDQRGPDAHLYCRLFTGTFCRVSYAGSPVIPLGKKKRDKWVHQLFIRQSILTAYAGRMLFFFKNEKKIVLGIVAVSILTLAFEMMDLRKKSFNLLRLPSRLQKLANRNSVVTRTWAPKFVRTRPEGATKISLRNLCLK